MVTRTASASDVQNVIETADLTTSEIQAKIDDAAYDADQAISDYTNKSTEFKTQLEKYLAALYIVETKFRSAKSERAADAAVTYEASQVAFLRRQVQKRDPSNTLARNDDTSRNIALSDPEDER